jgi:hypothetical protein
MAQQNNDLTLGTGLIRKGEAKGLNPAMAVPPKQGEAVAAPLPEAISAATYAPPAPVPMHAVPEAPQQADEEVDPPLRAIPPDDVAKRFTSFRLPVSLDEDLRAMMFETRRSKQDLLIAFVTEGLKGWKRDRAKRG